jgi:beta-lactamase regulating signal transducer with metallopeptidase domain/uncharacterized protein involved in exopolysaccharide biosynthesis
MGWILLHSLWQGALIGVGFALLRFALRKQSPQARYLAGCVCLALMLAAPMLTLLLGPVPVHESNLHVPELATSAPSATAEVINSSPAPSEENPVLGFIQSAANFLGRVAPWLTAAWLCGVAFSSCKLLRGFWWVQTIRRRDADLVNQDLLERLDELRRRLSICRPVRLLRSALVEVPTVVGWLRPVILLPASSLTGLTPGQLDAILVHELAHVRRWDYLVNIFQSLIETLMFYHPVVWWISRSIREEREHCCDDLVVKICGDRLAYARALTTLEELRAETAQFAFAASGGSLLHRVRRLLGANDGAEQLNVRQLGGVALLGIGLLLILFGSYLILATPLYRASARIKVDRDSSAQFSAENGKLTVTVADPYFTQNVFEEIKSEVVLNKVVNDLHLDAEWGKRFNIPNSSQKASQILLLLRRKLDLRAERNTPFFDISCLSDKPEEAKDIANSVARAYRGHSLEKLQNSSTLRALEERLKEQEMKVHMAQTNVDRLREQYKINEMDAAESPTMLMSAETLRRLEGMRIELDSTVLHDETLLATWKSLPREKLVNALPTTAPDPLLNSLIEQKTFCEQALIAKRQDFGGEHPEVVKYKTQLADLKAKIDDRLDGILLGMESRLLAVKEQLKKLNEEVEKAKAMDIANAKVTQPYWEAKRDLEDMQRFSQVLSMKIASEAIEAALPKRMLVEIMDEALTPFRPVYPNRVKAGVLILLGILLELAGLRMIRTKPRFTPVLQPA